MGSEFDAKVRAATFAFLLRERDVHGGAIPWDVIERGVQVDGRRVPIANRQQGIHKPVGLDGALTLKTTFARPGHEPYDDGFEPDLGLFRYHYRDPATPGPRAMKMAAADNRAVRDAMRHRLPVAYLFGVDKGWYLPVCPAYVVNDDPAARTFHVDPTELGASLTDVVAEPPERRYRAGVVHYRLHQARFRQLVLRAYRRSCAVCRLKHEELLDASHILTDADGGEPTVRNGLALCKLHHAAYDRSVLGIRPDLTVEINRRILEVVDGPLHEHGLLDFHGQRLMVLPNRREDRPDPELLERRYEQFRTAG